MTDDEKQRLAFARVILQRPIWMVVHDALDVLEPESRMRIRALFMGEFADVGIIDIGHDLPDEGIYVRKLQTRDRSAGATFKPAREHGIPNHPNRPAKRSPANKLRRPQGIFLPRNRIVC